MEILKVNNPQQSKIFQLSYKCRTIRALKQKFKEKAQD